MEQPNLLQALIGYEPIIDRKRTVIALRVRLKAIPFADIIDPKTNKSRVRGVDVSSDSYKAALALQERITAEDLADPAQLAALARAAKLSPEETKARYAVR